MKIRELIEKLNELDPDLEIIIQKDAEGNGYSPLAGIDSDGIYIKETSWHGEVYDSNWSADDAAMEEEEWSELLKQPRALILFPIN